MLNISIQQANALQDRVREFVKQGLTDDEIVDRLKHENLQRYDVESLIENAEDEKDTKRPFKHMMVLGCCLLGIGFIFGLMTYKVTENIHSLHFKLLCAFVIGGIISIGRAISLYRK